MEKNLAKITMFLANIANYSSNFFSSSISGKGFRKNSKILIYRVYSLGKSLLFCHRNITLSGNGSP